MAANNSSKDSDDKVFDVSKPGKTAASASSRPLIVGHKNMLKDPMVNEASVSELDEGKAVKIDKSIEDDAPSGSPPVPLGPEVPKAEDVAAMTAAPAGSKAIIEPLMEDETAKEPVEDTKIIVKTSPKSSPKNDTKKTTKPIIAPIAAAKDKPVEPVKDDKVAKDPVSDESKTETKPEAEETKAADETEAAETNADDKEAETDSKTDTDDKEPDSESKSTEDSGDEKETGSATSEAQKKAEKEAQEAAAKKAKMDKLIASKQYFVPIGEKTRKKRSFRRVSLGILLILLLGGALAYLMADVGIIKTSYKLPYHFFKQNTTTASSTPTPAQSQTTTTPTPQKYLEFKEFGVKLPLTSEIDGAYYTIQTKTAQDDPVDKAYVYDADFDTTTNKDGVSCKNASYPLFVISRIKQSDISKAQDPDKALYQIAKPINGYSYIGSSPFHSEIPCLTLESKKPLITVDTTVSETANDKITAFTHSFKVLSAQ